MGAFSKSTQIQKFPPTLTPNTYTIQFNANGGSGMMHAVSYAYDTIQTTDTLPPNTFTGTSAFKGLGGRSGGVQFSIQT